MTVCGGCGAETSRTRTKFNQLGEVTGEECDHCQPNSFDPQWKTAKPAMGWEAYPDKYTRKPDPRGGWMYIAKDEWRQDTLDKFQAAERREEKKYAEALEKKRQERRTTPLTPAEIQAALNKWGPIVKKKADEEKSERQKAGDAWLI